MSLRLAKKRSIEEEQSEKDTKAPHERTKVVAKSKGAKQKRLREEGSKKRPREKEWQKKSKHEDSLKRLLPTTTTLLPLPTRTIRMTTLIHSLRPTMNPTRRHDSSSDDDNESDDESDKEYEDEYDENFQERRPRGLQGLDGDD